MTYTDGQKSPENIRNLAMSSLDADKAQDIQVIDLRGQSSLADFMVVATGTSSRHVYALADKLAERLSKTGLSDINIEGQKTSDWVVVDAGDVIIHIFREEVRSFYALEKMWRNPTHPDMELVTA